jgi:DNA repair exonuclease SbcCD ATPase subunit
MSVELEVCERRLDRLEDAIEKLTNISGDLNKMLAVQDQRIFQQEKEMSGMNKVLEDRRREWEERMDAVYNTMRDEDHKIINKIEELRREQKSQHAELFKKVNDMQKLIWMYMGGFTVILFLLTNGSKIMNLLGNG